MRYCVYFFRFYGNGLYSAGLQLRRMKNQRQVVSMILEAGVSVSHALVIGSGLTLDKKFG